MTRDEYRALLEQRRDAFLSKAKRPETALNPSLAMMYEGMATGVSIALDLLQSVEPNVTDAHRAHADSLHHKGN